MDIKKMLEALGEQFDDKLWKPLQFGPTRQKRVRLAPAHNHGRGVSKTRRLMATRSNQINRRRVKRWKH